MSDVGNAAPGIGKHLAGALDPFPYEPTMRWHCCGFSEQGSEMPGAETNGVGDLIQTEIVAKSALKKLRGAAHSPVRPRDAKATLTPARLLRVVGPPANHQRSQLRGHAIDHQSTSAQNR